MSQIPYILNNVTEPSLQRSDMSIERDTPINALQRSAMYIAGLI